MKRMSSWMPLDRRQDGAFDMNQALCDDWDRHWTDFSEAAKDGPSTEWRCRLVMRLLGVPDDPSSRVLEIGSGAGEFAQIFCGRYSRTHFLGVEKSHTGVEFSRKRVPEAQFLERDLLTPPEDGQAMDFGATHALCSEVLEHVDDPGLLLRNAGAYMASGCKLVVTVPGGPRNAFYAHIGHRRHYTPDELKRLLESSGFEVETAFGAGFPFFNLFRLLLTWRGDKLIQDVSGPPSFMVRFGSFLFDILFRFNIGRRWGWQTLAVARYRSAISPR
jgi:SAM-dependent methyltransferase